MSPFFSKKIKPELRAGTFSDSQEGIPNAGFDGVDRSQFHIQRHHKRIQRRQNSLPNLV